MSSLRDVRQAFAMLRAQIHADLEGLAKEPSPVEQIRDDHERLAPAQAERLDSRTCGEPDVKRRTVFGDANNERLERTAFLSTVSSWSASWMKHFRVPLKTRV